MDELRQSNKELLQSLKIGQRKAWDILGSIKTSANNTSNTGSEKRNVIYTRGFPNSRSKTLATNSPQINKSVPPYTCSTPTKAYLHLLDNAGNKHYEKLRVTPKSRDTTLSTISRDISHDISRDGTVGRPHKTPNKNRTPSLEEPHSPYCTENHRERLHRKLNASYSKLAADLREIAPYCGADVIFNMADNSAVSVTGKPEAYYEELKRFRMANSDQCSVKLPDYVDVETEQETEDKENDTLQTVNEREHQCIQTYTVGDGYRARPDHSCKQCPLCIGTDDTRLKGLIRVNIPESEKVNYNVIKQNKKMENNLDSVSLSAHCSTGWEHAPSLKPKISTGWERAPSLKQNISADKDFYYSRLSRNRFL